MPITINLTSELSAILRVIGNLEKNQLSRSQDYKDAIAIMTNRIKFAKKDEIDTAKKMLEQNGELYYHFQHQDRQDLVSVLKRAHEKAPS